MEEFVNTDTAIGIRNHRSVGLRILLPQLQNLVDNLGGIGIGAIGFALILHQEPPELIGGHVIGAGRELVEEILDVIGWAWLRDSKLTVEAIEYLVAVGAHGFDRFLSQTKSLENDLTKRKKA